MLRSYVASAAGGRIILPQELLSQLRVGPDAVLYGYLHPPEKTIILSPIPPVFWNQAYKIIVHTHYSPGSLAAAANAIANLQLNTISSWASTESHTGHLSSISIVVAKAPKLTALGGASGISKRLEKQLGNKLSDLPAYKSRRLKHVRVTPLSILGSYGQDLIHLSCNFRRVRVSQYSLYLNKADDTSTSEKHSNLWEEVLAATGTIQPYGCILTADTEEALLRISVIPERSLLCDIVFHTEIKSEKESFAGYWKHALNLIAKHNYCIYIARNLIIAKSDSPSTEEAEFHFVADRERSHDAGIRVDELKKTWHQRFTKAFRDLAKKRHDKVKIKALNVTRPRGVGVPCFFSTNAKRGDGVGAHAAVSLCRILEGHGFLPVNIDLAKGGVGLRDQVRALAESCRFIVVLHCPEERNRKAPGIYAPSDWVVFEEGLMDYKQSEAIRLRFESVIMPSYGKGYGEIVVPNTGITSKIEDAVSERLERWVPLMSVYCPDNPHAPVISREQYERDLVRYYGGA